MQQAIDFLIANDPVLQTIFNDYGLPIIPSRPQGFQTLVLLILEQQVSINSAKATFIKLQSKVENFVPENLVVLTDQQFRNCGVSRQKTKYIKCLAQAILEKSINLESLSSKSSDAVRQELIKIKGIGHWTIDVYLMFCLNAPDILPLGDIAIINTIKELLNIHDKTAMELYTQKWAPHRSMATFLLWHYYLQKRGRTVVY